MDEVQNINDRLDAALAPTPVTTMQTQTSTERQCLKPPSEHDYLPLQSDFSISDDDMSSINQDDQHSIDSESATVIQPRTVQQSRMDPPTHVTPSPSLLTASLVSGL